MVVDESERGEVAMIDPPSEDIGFRIRVVAGDSSRLTNDEILLMTYRDDDALSGGRYLVNSEIRDKVMGDRVRIAMDITDPARSLWRGRLSWPA